MQMRKFGWLMMMLIGALGCSVAHAQEPSFDCSKARTKVEHILCKYSDQDLGWSDKTMSDLYNATLRLPGIDANALRASQRQWLAKRNRCSGTDVKIMNCLLGSYATRFKEIASLYDTARLTGPYAKEYGSLDIVSFPDRSLAVNAEGMLGPPSYNSCNLSFRAPLNSGKMDYTFPRGEGDEPNDPQCRIQMTQTSSGFQVHTEHCDLKCGVGVSLDGSYKR